ncbi:LysR substrate-binding domain-containing protein, partial [Klebsiella variicola]
VAILASIDEAEAFVTRRSSLARGTLRVSAPTSFGRLHIAPHLRSFLSANPDLVVHLELSDSFVDIVGEGYDLAVRI